MELRKQEKRCVRTGKRKEQVGRATLSGRTLAGPICYEGCIGPVALTAGHQNGVVTASGVSAGTYRG